MIPGICPKCGTDVTHPGQHRLDIQKTSTAPGFPAVTLKCQNINCLAILGFLPDYHALVDDVARAVIDNLFVGKRR